MKNTESIHALRGAAHEIRNLRRQVLEVKAEAWDVHSEVIKRLFSGPMGMHECAAHRAEKLAADLEQADANPVAADAAPPPPPFQGSDVSV